MKHLSFLLLGIPGFAQSISVGVKGGVPFTDAFSTGNHNPVSYSSVIRRYAVGPTAVIGLPLRGLRLEADALYHRIGWDSNRAGTPLLEPYSSTVRVGAWDFAAMLTHRIGRSGAHPYFGAGPALRRWFTTREDIIFPTPPSRFVSTQRIFEVQHKNIAGVVFSTGIELGTGLHVAPEFRYTRWLMNNIFDGIPNLSTQANQAEILVSITFGRK